jgi:chemotaxis protein histidine kinase CheA
MEKETENALPGETEIFFESVSDTGDNRPCEFIEPLKEIEEPAEGEEEIDPESDISADATSEQSPQSDTAEVQSEDNGAIAESAPSEPAVDDAIEEPAENPDPRSGEESRDDAADVLAEQDRADASLDQPGSDTTEDTELIRLDPSETVAAEKIESDHEDFNAKESHDGIDEAIDEEASEKLDEVANESTEIDDQEKSESIDEALNESVDSEAVTADEKQTRGKWIKLSLFSVLMCFIITGSLTYYNKSKNYNENHPEKTGVSPTEENPTKAPARIAEPQKIDPYARYRAKLREAKTLRESILIKRQEIQELKTHYGKGIVKLENDILVEILDEKLNNYEQALKNKRVELGLQTIQRRQAYIDKLQDPMIWLHQSGEELLYLKRKAAFDLQLIEIADSIDMNMHMRHINAALQKYRLTAENLAIDPAAAEMEPLIKIWERLHVRTRNNPLLRVELDNWYIQQEICSGNLSRIGALSTISIETAKCLPEIEASDLFLNNITELSPSVIRYLCQWDGKWLCLNGVKALSPAVAAYLFQWQGEWISLNGLSDFHPEQAKYLLQWQGTQLELMGLNDKENLPDRLTLTYLVEWEKAGGKLFVPRHIRNLMNAL